MRAPNHDPLTVLKALRSTSGASMHAGVYTMFRLLDAMPQGLTSTEATRLTGYNRSPVVMGCQVLRAQGCVTSEVVPTYERGKDPTVWTGTPKLVAVTGEYNALVATLLSPCMSEIAGRELSAQDVRTAALGRLASGLRLDISPADEPAVFAAMPQRMGHAHSIAHRALMGMAEIEGMARHLHNELFAITK
ncbi:MAG TPA: hypothetical protein VD735_06355 [Candidatus Saccharimonadales bacterium]|nr:hypothetical protein [Candidatus Saccharimonadales bacterium]